MVKEIPLTRGMVAIVDDEDFEALNKHKWYAKKSNHCFYACRNLPNGKHIRMHHEIMGRVPGMYVDHINRISLDNRRENLRICTPVESRKNQANVGKYPGVRRDKSRGVFVAQIVLGRFKTFDEAVASIKDHWAKLGMSPPDPYPTGEK